MADAAALAGAQSIDDGTAATIATQYSSTAGNKGEVGSMPVTMYPGYPLLKCLTTTNVPCSGPSTANAIVVVQEATVPLYLGRVLGFNTMTVRAKATASAAGGPPPPLNVVLVVDTTASMNGSDSSCSISGATRLTCALAGARTLMGQLWPSIDQIGMMTFPGLTNASQVPKEFDCAATPDPAIAKYNAAPVYQIIPLSTDYRLNDTATNLATGSHLVKAAQGGATGCKQGLDAVGGVSTYYANAITAAQSVLASNSRVGVQNVIIFLSDGDANASSSNVSIYANQCQQAITAAQAAATAGTAVYSIAYGASTSKTGSCSTDNPHISACSTLQQMASDPSKFYSDNVNGSSSCTSAANPVSELVSIFQRLTKSLTTTRLVPDDTL